MRWFKRRYERPSPYSAPPSEQFLELLRQEADAIAQGNTAGSRSGEDVPCCGVTRENQPSWVISASPFDPGSIIDAEIMFVASVTFATAIYLVKQGAEVID
ncbi:hypothetical protein Mycsm_01770 [Mycobacterium sp. JS623]|uniref:hypothetical protein n=1 Tax=Mycobacterium sp. JS623 TaxID=212767 RepID=UPI0002A59D68|nr:hypothetical protein [Mycobacterium sp. JS623]AGB22161.1 hypothetical protein Mycsm_01770 [Mycobacterium sp. JS623]